jgi:hypothetical protein
MQQRDRSAPADTATTPVERCPSCATLYSDEGSFIGRFWLGRTTNFHCWCSSCGFTCDITAGAPDGAAGSGQPVAAGLTPAPLCPSCGQPFAGTSSQVTEHLTDERQTVYACRCGACRFKGTITPVHRIITHEAAD